MLKKAVIGAAALASIAAHADMRDIFSRYHGGIEVGGHAYQSDRDMLDKRWSDIIPTVGLGGHVNSYYTFGIPMSVGVVVSPLWLWNNAPSPKNVAENSESVRDAAERSSDYIPRAGLGGFHMKGNIGNLGPVKLSWDAVLGSIWKENAGLNATVVGGVSGKYRLSNNTFGVGGIKWVQPVRELGNALLGSDKVELRSRHPRGFAAASFGLSWNL